ncbi:MAG TPA: patatin-like phospholipase family protein [Pyrinomonadaceae bacterium]|jgi:patatin-like phospholipase/acyl hydrolase
MANFRIISFDGGGVRGALMAALVQRIVEKIPDFLDKVDLLAGTSTGAMMALGLADGKTAAEMVEVYSQENMKFIFSPAGLGIFRPKYGNANLIALLQKYFREGLTMGELKKRVMISTFELDDKEEQDWSPVFFHNYPPRGKTKVKTGWSELVISIALRSSAAPTIFPSHQGYIDGGVMANNPGTAALSVALGQHADSLRLRDIRLLSLGTGLSPTLIKENTANWGIFQWMFNSRPPQQAILKILFDGVSEADTVMCKQMLGGSYLRLNPRLPQPMALDNWKLVPALVEIAQKFDLEPTLDWIKQNWTDSD